MSSVSFKVGQKVRLPEWFYPARLGWISRCEYIICWVAFPLVPQWEEWSPKIIVSDCPLWRKQFKFGAFNKSELTIIDEQEYTL